MTDGLAFLDLDLAGRELNDPLAELYQDLVHRLLEPPGSNLADLDRGVGIFALLSGKADVAAIARAIESDFSKDDRVQACSAKLTALGDGAYAVDIQVQCDEDKLGIALVANADGTIQEAT